MSNTSPTKIEPLKFFKSFLKKESLDNFEDQFYNNPINPSQERNISQGYIEFQKEIYIDDEEPIVRKYFDNEIRNLFKANTDFSYNLLLEHKRELLYLNNESSKFLETQLLELIKLISKTKKLKYSKVLVPELQSFQDKLELLITDRLNPYKPQRLRGVILPTFFGNKTETDKKYLKKAYLILTSINILSKFTTSEAEFIEVLTSPNPLQLESRITFNKNNYHSIYFLKLFSNKFENFSWSNISRSKSFYSKRDTAFNQNTLDKYSTMLKKMNVEKYQYIDDAFDCLI